jgi:hypothetical protein
VKQTNEANALTKNGITDTIYYFYHPKAFADFAAASSNACLGSSIP